MSKALNQQAQVRISCRDLNKEMDFFLQLGFKLQQVFPADNPRMMVLAGYGLCISFEKGLPVNDLTVILPNDSKQKLESLYSPSGVAVQFQQVKNTNVALPHEIKFSVETFNAAESWVTGRAGMMYRDLIPNRLSGAIIASNIKIVEGGPVPDHVHFHDIQFQLIFCTKGWVKVVYEDQGEPFILKAGDCVTQPQGIRHQVLEASAGLEVVEIGLPAEHMTTLDYQMQLPTGQNLPGRRYHGQKFSYHQQAEASWHQILDSDLLSCETSVFEDSAGLAAVNVLKVNQSNNQPSNQTITKQHETALQFYYLISGTATLHKDGQEAVQLKASDSFVLPPNQSIELGDFSAEFKCIEFIWLAL